MKMKNNEQLEGRVNSPPFFNLTDGSDRICVNPCRNCGAIPVFYTYGPFETLLKFYNVSCPNCGRKKRDFVLKRLEDRWNDNK